MQKFLEKYVFESQITPYPFYHVGDYLEQTFFKFYLNHLKEFEKTGWVFIPVTWTDLYLTHSHLLNELQKDLNTLDPSKKYFTVSQHDNAPSQVFPHNTVHFSAGGNIDNTICIPLICSAIPEPEKYTKTKDIFCSFVGSVTQNVPGFGHIAHRVRMSMLETLVDNPSYVLKPKHWSHDIKSERQNLFLNLTGRSKFALAPRGYGATSFRLYEALQLEAIPIYIYDIKKHLPYEKEVDWNKLAIVLHYKEISKLNSILQSISEEEISERKKYIQEVYSKYFTLESLGPNILKILKTLT